MLAALNVGTVAGGIGSSIGTRPLKPIYAVDLIRLCQMRQDTRIRMVQAKGRSRFAQVKSKKEGSNRHV